MRKYRSKYSMARYRFQQEIWIDLGTCKALCKSQTSTEIHATRRKLCLNGLPGVIFTSSKHASDLSLKMEGESIQRISYAKRVSLFKSRWLFQTGCKSFQKCRSVCRETHCQSSHSCCEGCALPSFFCIHRECFSQPLRKVTSNKTRKKPFQTNGKWKAGRLPLVLVGPCWTLECPNDQHEVVTGATWLLSIWGAVQIKVYTPASACCRSFARAPLTVHKVTTLWWLGPVLLVLYLIGDFKHVIYIYIYIYLFWDFGMIINMVLYFQSLFTPSFP